MVIDTGFQYDLMKLFEIFTEGRMVAVDNLVWLDKYRRTTFHVEKACRTLEGKLQFLGIEQMKHTDIVLAESEVLEAIAKERGIDEQVGKKW